MATGHNFLKQRILNQFHFFFTSRAPVCKIGDICSSPVVEDHQRHVLDWTPGVPHGALEHGVEGEDGEDVPSPGVHLAGVHHPVVQARHHVDKYGSVTSLNE